MPAMTHPRRRQREFQLVTSRSSFLIAANRARVSMKSSCFRN